MYILVALEHYPVQFLLLAIIYITTLKIKQEEVLFLLFAFITFRMQ